MNASYLRLTPLSIALALALAAPAARAADGPYTFKKDIAIGGEGGWDTLLVHDEPCPSMRSPLLAFSSLKTMRPPAKRWLGP